MKSPHTPYKEQLLLAATREKPKHSSKDPVQPKIKKFKKKNTLNEIIANQKVRRLVILKTEQETLSKLKQGEKKKKRKTAAVSYGTLSRSIIYK